MAVPVGFREKVAEYSNVQLAEIIEASSDYTPEALEVVLDEWNKRKLTVDAIVDDVAEIKLQKDLAKQPKPIMSRHFKGIGVTCYGRDYGSSIGYTTTQWFCLFLLPLFPIQSFLVQEQDFRSIGTVASTQINWRQVRRTYAFMIVLVALACGLSVESSVLYDSGHEYWSVTIWSLMLVPFIGFQLLRRSRRRKRLTSR